MKLRIVPAMAFAMALPVAAFAQSDSDKPEVRPNATPPAAAVTTGPVVAFGAVNQAGTKSSGTPNWSVVYNATLKRYEITILNEAYFWTLYTTVVTPQGQTLSLHPAVTCKTDSVSSKLLVQCYNRAFTPVPAYFTFITHKY